MQACSANSLCHSTWEDHVNFILPWGSGLQDPLCQGSRCLSYATADTLSPNSLVTMTIIFSVYRLFFPYSTMAKLGQCIVTKLTWLIIMLILHAHVAVPFDQPFLQHHSCAGQNLSLQSVRFVLFLVLFLPQGHVWLLQGKCSRVKSH